MATAIFVPAAVAMVWIVTRNIRRRHLKHDDMPPTTWLLCMGLSFRFCVWR
ncbi:hypothetical protein [Bradyrhizobium amphicarpaeae]|uniref:hypothetical protein n=1 Tax=Bradyrhizobium amphicarpaeae TaxID=1404768 RepID=UPI0039C8854C